MKHYRDLFNHSRDGIVMIALDGRIIKCNPAYCEMLGYSEKELQNMTFYQLTPARWHEWEKNEIIENKLIKIGYTGIYEKEYIRKDGTVFPVELSAFSISSAGGKPSHLWGIVRDITERKQIETEREKLERQLHQSQKMEAIGTLAGGIAHDFNNILCSIFGYAQLIEINRDDSEKVKKNINQLMKGAARASGLVRQILTFSRQAENEQIPQKMDFIVREAVKFMRSSIPSNIEIKEHIMSRKTVLADATQVHQVVMNLCTNAYHAMGKEVGELTVSLSDTIISHQEISDETECRPGPYILLEIRDTGRGMDQETKEMIFYPYFTTKSVGQGTGLGLSVVDGIIKRHKGFIRVSSEPGQGSSFQVYWPAVVTQAAQAPAKAISTDWYRGMEKIMLVDDEEDILETLGTVLEKFGYRVRRFSDGAKALAAFEADPDGYDFIITDMTMPKMKGDALAARVLEIRKDIPVIVCTGLFKSGAGETGSKTGIRLYVQKPVTGKELALIIRKELALDGNTP